MKSTVQRRQTLVSKTALKFPFGESPICPVIRNHQLLSWMILVFCLIEHSHNEPSSPQNLATVNGQEVRLTCSMKPNKKLIWSVYNYTGRNQKNREPITSGDEVLDEYKDRFSLDSSTKGNLDLLFTADERSTGLFACQKDKADGIQNSAHVIVLDQGVICSRRKEADGSARADCSIGFSGFWPPELEWFQAGAKLETNDTTTTNKVTSSYLAKLKSSTPYDLTCTPKFTLENKPTEKPKHTDAQNIPEVPPSCTITIGKPDERTTKWTKEEDKDSENPSATDTPSATVSIHDWHNLHLSLSLATLVFIGMLHKWLWQ